MAHEHLPPIEGGANPCFNCPPITTQALPEKIIAVGFGEATLRRDGNVVIDGENPPGDDFFTFADAEEMARLDPDHDWKVVLNGPMHGETYQRQGPRVWMLVARNEGFA